MSLALCVGKLSHPRWLGHSSIVASEIAANLQSTAVEIASLQHISEMGHLLGATHLKCTRRQTLVALLMLSSELCMDLTVVEPELTFV